MSRCTSRASSAREFCAPSRSQHLVRGRSDIPSPSNFIPRYSYSRDVGFDGYEHTEWVNKHRLEDETRALAGDRLKTVAVHCGGFMSWMLDPYRSVCANVPANTFRCLGSAAVRSTYTALPDIGRAVARLALLALDPATAASVPADARVCGDVVSTEEIRDAVARVRGVEKGPIEVGDVAAVRKRLRENQPPTLMDIVDYAR